MAVVIDAAMMKEQVREKLTRPEYDVSLFYSEAGVFQALARSEALAFFMNVVILIYTIWAAIDTDYNDHDSPGDADLPFLIMAFVFPFIFCLEVLIRFMAFKRKRDALRDSWFLIDAVLAPLMILDAWVPEWRIFQILCRTVRLWRTIPEMWIILKGLGTAMRSTFFCLCLYCFLTYAFGYALVTLTRDTQVGEQHFSTVIDSMHSLLLHGIFAGAHDDLLTLLNETKPVAEAFFVVFIYLHWTVLLLTLGVTCEVISVVSTVEKEKLTLDWMKQQVVVMAEKLETSDGTILTKENIEELIGKQEFVTMLQALEIDVMRFIDCLDILFPDNLDTGEFDLTVSDLTFALGQLRSSNQATKKDINDLQKSILVSQSEREAKVKESVIKPLSARLAKVEDGLKELLKKKKTSGMSKSSTNAPDPDAPDPDADEDDIEEV